MEQRKISQEQEYACLIGFMNVLVIIYFQLLAIGKYENFPLQKKKQSSLCDILHSHKLSAAFTYLLFVVVV